MTGFLKYSDFSIFSSKIGGSGTTNTFPMFTGTSTLGNSGLSQTSGGDEIVANDSLKVGASGTGVLRAGATTLSGALSLGSNTITTTGAGSLGSLTLTSTVQINSSTPTLNLNSTTEFNQTALNFYSNSFLQWQTLKRTTTKQWGIYNNRLSTYAVLIDTADNKMTLTGGLVGTTGVFASRGVVGLLVGNVDLGGTVSNRSVINLSSSNELSIFKIGQSTTAFGQHIWRYNATEASAYLDIQSNKGLALNVNSSGAVPSSATDLAIGATTITTTASLSSGLITSHNNIVSDSSFTINERTTTPTYPTSNTQMRSYMKSDKIIWVINSAGTPRFYYFDATLTADQQIKYSATAP
jgi:hypothetical protein